jgi:hypothetical protein
MSRNSNPTSLTGNDPFLSANGPPLMQQEPETATYNRDNQLPPGSRVVAHGVNSPPLVEKPTPAALSVLRFINSLTYPRTNSPAERPACPSQRAARPRHGVSPPAGAQFEFPDTLSHGLTPVASRVSPPVGVQQSNPIPVAWGVSHPVWVSLNGHAIALELNGVAPPVGA